MKHARSTTSMKHRADLRTHRDLESSIPQIPEDRTAKSKSIENLVDEDMRTIERTLHMLPAEYVRKVRIYAQTLEEIFMNR